MRPLEAGEIVAGKYRLQRLLAKGGMGSVWTAWNLQLEVPVAIKFMSPDALGSAELIARFEREAKAAAQMRVPQVVQIFEHGADRGVPFLVMELLDGEDLGKRLRARRRLSLVETAHIVGEVCKALRRAHELGIVHRDLKPANVFLARSGDEEVVKVLDFGIAKVPAGGAESEATRTGSLIGTPHYMSPEQARRTHRQVDHRSDLWSLAVVAFRAITGRLPFAGDDPVDILVRICTQPAPPASSVAPDLGPEVDRFFARALAFEPDDRFQTARELSAALSALAGAAAPLSLPPSSLSPSPGWNGAPELSAPAPRPAAPSRPSGPDGAWPEPVDPVDSAATVRLASFEPSPQAPPAPWTHGNVAPGAASPGIPARPSLTPAPGDSAGTITSATAEMPTERQRRTSPLVWIAGASAVLLVAAAGVVATAITPGSEPQPANVSASGVAPTSSPTLPTVAPAGTPSADTPAAPSPVAGTSASATAVAVTSAAPTTKPSSAPATTSPKPGGGKPQGAAKGGSAIFGKPVFSP